jgi:hypothetical protein
MQNTTMYNRATKIRNQAWVLFTIFMFWMLHVRIFSLNLEAEHTRTFARVYSSPFSVLVVSNQMTEEHVDVMY